MSPTDQLLTCQTSIAADVESLWAKNDLPSDVIDKHLWHSADVKMYQQLGAPETSRAIELLGLRLVSLARFTELDLASLLKEKARLAEENVQMKKKLVENLNVVNSAEKTKSELIQSQTKLSKALKDLHASRSESKKVEEEKEELARQLKIAQENIDQFDSRLEAMQRSVAAQLNDWFESAVAQVAYLYPNLNLSQVSVFKEIRDGQLLPVQVDEKEKEEKVESTADNVDKADNR